jgi:hypothetical protein
VSLYSLGSGTCASGRVHAFHNPFCFLLILSSTDYYHFYRINEILLTELLASRSCTDLQTLSFAYHRQYKKELQTDVRSNLAAKTETGESLL